MKCPVCDQENSTLLCSQCGFDASRDYARYPSFGPVSRMPSVSAKRKQWPDSQKKPMSSSDGPQFVDYRKMVSDAAKADKQHRQSREIRKRDAEIVELKSQLETAQSRIAELEAALEAERNKGVLSRIFKR
ncbi:MAG: hypothetical protein IJE58_02410 [Oscillospiraceae bacterium]|nr:hypothetical protein [Oscillospiraceae bacterium]